MINKYVLEYFLDKIAELTPNINHNKNKFFYKETKSLDATRKHFTKKIFIRSRIKRIFLLYLIINNLKLFQENDYLVKDIKLFTEVNKQIFNEIIQN